MDRHVYENRHNNQIGGGLTPAPADSGSAARGAHLIKSGAGMKTSLGRTAAACEPIRWAAE
jgi:hypothetical protein